jgi:NADH-quinone oxidoreductase subunit L
MPITFLTYAVGMLTLSGVPLFFSGAWTKEEILHATAHWPSSQLPYYLMMAGVVLTALYMTRQMIYVFFGDRREASQQAHESPPVMTLPLIVLAACSVLFSVVLTPAWPWLHDYLAGDATHFEIGKLIQPMLFVSFLLVAAGIGLGWLFYGKAGSAPDPLEQKQPALFRWLEEKMWVDEVYDSTVIALARFAARVSDWMDRYFWDGLVYGLGGIGQLFGMMSKGVDEGGINAGVDHATDHARGVGHFLSTAHSGQIQRYLGAVAVGMLALLLLYAWLA